MATVITQGLTESLKALQGMQARADAAARVIVIQSAALLEAEAKRNFVGSHAKGEPHVGGDKPNVVTGMLRRSITHDRVERYGVGSWRTRVGPTAIYGRRVELGYPGGAGRGRQRTRPFPFMQPAVASTRMRMASIAATNWAKAFNG